MKYTTRKVSSISFGGAGCLNCGNAVGPRLGALQIKTGFPGLPAASQVSCGTLSSGSGGGGGGDRRAQQWTWEGAGGRGRP